MPTDANKEIPIAICVQFINIQYFEYDSPILLTTQHQCEHNENIEK